MTGGGGGARPIRRVKEWWKKVISTPIWSFYCVYLSAVRTKASFRLQDTRKLRTLTVTDNVHVHVMQIRNTLTFHF